MTVLFLSTIIITGNSQLAVINVIIVGQGRALQLEICALEPPDELRTCVLFFSSCTSQAVGLRHWNAPNIKMFGAFPHI